jgi:hypothetical protein
MTAFGWPGNCSTMPGSFACVNENAKQKISLTLENSDRNYEN